MAMLIYNNYWKTEMQICDFELKFLKSYSCWKTDSY